jgi:hypothetical protein
MRMVAKKDTAVADDPFGEPGSSGGGKFPSMKQLAGRLLLVQPHTLTKGVVGAFGPQDRMTSHVHVLDGDPITEVLDKDGDVAFTPDEPWTPPVTLEDLYISQRGLVNQLKSAYKAEGMVLGRLRIRKLDSGNKMFELEPASTEDKALAREFLAKKKDSDPWD